MHLDGIGSTRCEEKAGFLFSHVCGELAAAKCDRCGKAICPAHQSAVGSSMLGGGSGGGAPGEEGDDAGGEPQGFGAGGAGLGEGSVVCVSCAKALAVGSGGVTDLSESPFFYSSAYGGYGYSRRSRWGRSGSTNRSASDNDREDEEGPDGDDFTEADGGSVSTAAGHEGAGSGDFEMETSGS